MSLKQNLYLKKQAVIAARTPKMKIGAEQKIIIAQDCDTKPFADIFSGYAVSDGLKNIADEDLGRIECYFGAPDKAKLPKMTSLKWLQLSSAGLNGYDDKSLYSAPDVKLTNAKGIYGLPISECVIADILFLIKPAMSNTVNKKYRIPPFEGKEFSGSRVIICGMGDIGRNIAARCKGMKCADVTGFDKFVKNDENADRMFTLDKLRENIGEADFVISALPAVPETEGIFDGKMFAAMKDGAVFVNVGRGSAVDQQALLENINNSHLFGAALDATTPDPLPESHPLRRCGRVLVTEHLACISSVVKQRLEKYYISQSERYIKGELN